MRLPQKATSIDMARSADMIHSAIENGVNYFDTAYIYPRSEAALGQILAGEWRPRIKLATKMPLLLTRSGADFDKYFAEQLERLQTDYIDYYLMHMLIDLDNWEKLRRFGVEDWIAKEKERGRIRNIGFSFHGRQESFKSILDAYDWDFCMIQYNYLDENHQAGTSGLHYASAKGLPVMVMEPLRGGMLANNLPEAAAKEFSTVHPQCTPAEWGLKWVWDHPEVTLLLSGMGNKDQVDENIRLASETHPGSITEPERETYKKVVAYMRRATKVPCTGCGYCLPCPAGVDIPNVFSSYNDTSILRKNRVVTSYLASAGILPAKPTFASQCKRCGKCETHCPQSIPIMDTLAAASKTLEPFWIKPVARIAKQFTVGNNTG